MSQWSWGEVTDALPGELRAFIQLCNTRFRDLTTKLRAVASTPAGGGTTGKLVKWSGGTALADSIVSESGTTITVAGTAVITDRMAIAGALDSARALNVTPTALAGTSQYGVVSIATSSSAATSSTVGGYFVCATAAASYTCTTTYGILIETAVKGSGSTITTNIGLLIGDQTVGGTNYAINGGLGIYKFGGGLRLSLVSKAVDYTATDNDYTILVDASGAARTITLPAVSGRVGTTYNIKKTDSSANTVTVDGNASETIDGATTKVLTTQYQSVTIQSDGSTWWVL